MSIPSRDLIFLVGAGASAEAGIPTSAKMIEELESALKHQADWSDYFALYNHVKSSIVYKEGLSGRFGANASYNIETLVNTLYELERNEEHPLFPFIASWNLRFAALAGEGFDRVKKFRHLILNQLKGWMCPQDPGDGNYYEGFKEVQREFNFPLRIFSLNYDRCIEKIATPQFVVETGFAGLGPRHIWSYQRFIEAERGSDPLPQVFLYKLHGSIDWIRDKTTKELSRVDEVQRVQADQMEIIFGRDFKLDAADPYLFYAYEFRQAVLNARLIVVIGYSFQDHHINKMINQGVKMDSTKRLLVISKAQSDIELNGMKTEFARRLEVSPDVVLIELGSAADFLRKPDIGEMILGCVPALPGSPF